MKHTISTTELGAFAERQARGYLEKLGWKIMATNFRGKHKEIDIIAREQDTLVFVEVRSRKWNEYQRAEESITPQKRRYLVYLARHFLAEQVRNHALGWADGVRFDLIAYNGGEQTHIRNFIQVDGKAS